MFKYLKGFLPTFFCKHCLFKYFLVGVSFEVVL